MIANAESWRTLCVIPGHNFCLREMLLSLSRFKRIWIPNDTHISSKGRLECVDKLSRSAMPNHPAEATCNLVCNIQCRGTVLTGHIKRSKQPKLSDHPIVVFLSHLQCPPAFQDKELLLLHSFTAFAVANQPQST
jgi:hypothetical protein